LGVGRQPVRAGSQREPQGYAASSGGDAVRSGSHLAGEYRDDLPEVFPSRDDLSDDRDLAGGDDDLDDDFDVPSFLK
jgi:hypothetical protein